MKYIKTERIDASDGSNDYKIVDYYMNEKDRVTNFLLSKGYIIQTKYDSKGQIKFEIMLSIDDYNYLKDKKLIETIDTNIVDYYWKELNDTTVFMYIYDYPYYNNKQIENKFQIIFYHNAALRLEKDIKGLRKMVFNIVLNPNGDYIINEYNTSVYTSYSSNKKKRQDYKEKKIVNAVREYYDDGVSSFDTLHSNKKEIISIPNNNEINQINCYYPYNRTISFYDKNNEAIGLYKKISEDNIDIRFYDKAPNPYNNSLYHNSYRYRKLFNSEIFN